MATRIEGSVTAGASRGSATQTEVALAVGQE